MRQTRGRQEKWANHHRIAPNRAANASGLLARKGYDRLSERLLKESNLSIDDIRLKYDASKRACMQNGLRETGYEHPEDYYSGDR